MKITRYTIPLVVGFIIWLSVLTYCVFEGRGWEFSFKDHRYLKLEKVVNTEIGIAAVCFNATTNMGMTDCRSEKMEDGRFLVIAEFYR